MGELTIKDEAALSSLIEKDNNNGFTPDTLEPVNYLSWLEGNWYNTNNDLTVSFLKKKVSLSLLGKPNLVYVNKVIGQTNSSSPLPSAYALIGTLATSEGDADFALYLTTTAPDTGPIQFSYEVYGGTLRSSGTLSKK